MKFTYTEKKDTRSGFGAGLAELADKNPNVVALCADLIGSLKMEKFIEKAPERFVQTGIAEANMMGIAAGLATAGKIPFAGTFANFATSRVLDQVRQSIAYSNKNVKIAASHAGLTLGEDGATHQVLEDIGQINLTKIDWVIVGGESGNRARKMEATWVRSIRDQCKQKKIAFFFKQWGGYRPKSGGRELDGREWNQLPDSRSAAPRPPVSRRAAKGSSIHDGIVR